MKGKPLQLSEGRRQHKELNRCCSSPQQCCDHTFLLLCTSLCVLPKTHQIEAQHPSRGTVQVVEQVCKDAGLVWFLLNSLDEVGKVN